MKEQYEKIKLIIIKHISKMSTYCNRAVIIDNKSRLHDCVSKQNFHPLPSSTRYQ